MQEIQVQSLGWEDPLEKGMATTHSNIPAWRIPWTEESRRLQSMGLQRVRYDLATKPPPLQINNGMIVSGEQRRTQSYINI